MSVVASALLRRLAAGGGDGHHDDAQRQHRQSHEFEHKCVHGNLPQQNLEPVGDGLRRC
jgi:hypothetical protein